MPEVQEVFRMATQKVRPDPGFLERQRRQQHRKDRNRKLGAIGVAAVICAAAAVLIFALKAGSDRTQPADTAPSARSAERIAGEFVDAFGAFDGERAVSYLADDAYLEMDATTPSQVPVFTSFLEDMGYEQILADSCRVTNSSDAATEVRCPFEWHAIRSDEIGQGPYPGSWDLSVRGGEIFVVSLHWQIKEFSPQMWEPFRDWVRATYPKDFDAMYVDDGGNFRLTEESSRLWERHSRQYVDMVNAENARVAERFMEARNAYDVEGATSLVADGAVTAQLMNNNRPDSSMFPVRLDHAAVALAFEAERLYGVRYDSVECGGYPDGDRANVACTFAMDSRLIQIAGLPPVTSSFTMGVHHGRIDYLSFPWMNVSFPSNVPVSGWRFIRWLQAEHPDAVGDLGLPDGKVFRVEGQEWIQVLTPEALDLLGRYLDEYERAVGG